MNLHHGARSLLFPVSSGTSQCPQHCPGVQFCTPLCKQPACQCRTGAQRPYARPFPTAQPLPHCPAGRAVDFSWSVTCSEEGLCGRNPLFFPLSLLVWNSHLQTSWGRVMGPRDANLPNMGVEVLPLEWGLVGGGSPRTLSPDWLE